MEKLRLVDQRTKNNVDQSFSPIAIGIVRDDVTKSVPDLLDSKYVEFRRPWYGNPNYKGPRNTILSMNHLSSPEGSVYSVKSIQTLHRNQGQSMFRSSAQQMNFGTMGRKCIGDREHAKLSNTDSEPLKNYSFFSFENLHRDKSESVQPSVKLSSSPESVFSGSSGRQSNRDSINSSFLHMTRSGKRELRSKPNSISPRHPGSDFLVEERTPRYASRSGQSSFISKADNQRRVQTTCQNREHPNYTEIIAAEGNPVVSNINVRSSPKPYLDDRMVQTWKKRTCSESDESELTSVTDDDFSNSSPPSRQSYRRPLPGTIQARSEALFYVFTYLDLKSLAQCGGVNKQWYNVSREPVLWTKVRLKDCFISPSTFSHMTKWCTKVKEIEVQKILTKNKLVQPKKSNGLDINAYEASLGKLLEINKETIKTVKIIDCDDVISHRIIWSISTMCRNLTKLVYLSRTHPLGQEDLFPLGRGCPGLTSLVIPPGWPNEDPDKFNDACCDTISKCWAKLQILCIGGRNLTMKGLQHIAIGCVKLHHLEIDHGPEIPEDGASQMVAVGLSGLEKLDFTFTPVSPRAVVIFNNACPKLNRIGIHCNISDYFSDPNSTKSKSNYNSLKALFRRLKTRTGFRNVLDINLDYGK